MIYGRLRSRIERILRDLCDQRGIELVEGHAHGDHVHPCSSIPPKFSVLHTVGFLKAKSAVWIDREVLHERCMRGLRFWATGYGVSTVGLDDRRVRKYIREQRELGAHQGDLDLKWNGQWPQRVLPPENGPFKGPSSSHALWAWSLTVPAGTPLRGDGQPAPAQALSRALLDLFRACGGPAA